MGSVRAPKRAINGQAACSAERCARAARLEVVLAENTFLGETVDGLKEMIDVANQAGAQKDQIIANLKEQLQDCQSRLAESEEKLVESSRQERKLAGAVEQCQLLRDDKTFLLKQTWMALKQLSDVRQRNERLESDIVRIRDELDRNQLESRLEITTFTLSKVEYIRRKRHLGADDFQIIANEIERLEAEAMAGERLEQELYAEQKRSESIKQLLNESIEEEKKSRELVATYIDKEAQWINQLRRIMDPALELESAPV